MYINNNTMKSFNIDTHQHKDINIVEKSYIKMSVEEVKSKYYSNIDDDLFVADEFQSGEIPISEDIVRRKERKPLASSTSSSQYILDGKDIRLRSVSTLQIMTGGLFNPKSFMLRKNQRALDTIIDQRRDAFSTVLKAEQFEVNGASKVDTREVKMLGSLQRKSIIKIKSTAQPPKKMPDNYIDTEESINKDSSDLKQTNLRVNNREEIYNGIFARKGPIAAEICARYKELPK